MTRCGLVFLDPDNGLAPPGVRRHTDAGTQYAFLDELLSFVDLGKAVMLIQFFRRDVPRTEQIRQRVHEIRAVIPGETPPLALWWRHRVSLAFYLVPATPEQAVILRTEITRLTLGPVLRATRSAARRSRKFGNAILTSWCPSTTVD